MNKSWKILTCGAFTLVLAGCATIVKGTTQTVFVDTPGYAGAQCTLTSTSWGTRIMQTPGSIKLEKASANVSVQCVKGCFKGGGIIASNTEAMTAGNILLGGVIGLGVDAASGAMNRYNDNNQIALTRDPTCTG